MATSHSKVHKRWSEDEDEAHRLDCVVLEVELPDGAKTKELEVCLRSKGLSISLQGRCWLRESFAEEGWLNLDESYWELGESEAFLPDTGRRRTRALKYFLVKNVAFQKEPLYCLFTSELKLPEELESPEADAAAEAHAAATRAREEAQEAEQAVRARAAEAAKAEAAKAEAAKAVEVSVALTALAKAGKKAESVLLLGCWAAEQRALQRAGVRCIVADEAAVSEEAASAALIAPGVLERCYFSWGPVLMALAERGALLLLPGDGQMGNKAVLRGLGCRGEDGCLHGGARCGATELRRAYRSIRHALQFSVDFRPGGAEAARLAWEATGASCEDCATAAAVAAVESTQGGPYAAAAAALAAARSAGGGEARALAAAALLGLREGMYTWAHGRSLAAHATETAAMVAEALGAGGAWQGRDAEERGKRLQALVSAGGLRRPGELALALCQARMGAGVPSGGSRLKAAMAALRKGAGALLAAAALPNMLEEEGAEARAFGATVLEGLNLAKLSALLCDGSPP